MTHEIAVIPFPFRIPVTKLHRIVLDLSNPDISRNSVVRAKRTTSPASGSGVWFELSIELPSGDVKGLREVLDRFEVQQRISDSALTPLG